MSIENPKPFNVLRVAGFNPGDAKNDPSWAQPRTLTCLTRNSVHITYADNSNYTLGFNVYNDGSQSYADLSEGAKIYAGDQVFVITKYSKTVAGEGTASVNAEQLVNAYFQRVICPYQLYYSTGSINKQADKDAQNAALYKTLPDLLSWFWRHSTSTLGFKYKVHGYFPRRYIKNQDKWTGKSLISAITQTWPGTVIIGWGHIIHIYGFRKDRDKNGNLQNVRDIDTNKRIDAIFDTKSLSVSRDMSQMCNAIEVKAGTHYIKPDADDEESEELVYKQVPNFPNFLAISQSSIQQYGVYASTQVLEDNFGTKKAAMAAAREKMVLEPVIQVTGKVDHPGKTEAQPIPGYKYTVGIREEGELHHVILRGYDWYPFDSTQGVQMTLASVDKGIIDNLKSIIVHYAELSPSVMRFKELTDTGVDESSVAGDISDDDGEATDDDLDDDDTDDQTGADSDTDGDVTDTDDQQDRPDDTPQPGAGKRGDGVKAYLPIGDRKTNTEITRYGGLTLNKKIGSWNIRVTNDNTIKKMHDGTFDSSDISDITWRHLMKIDYHFGDTWRADEKLRRYYQESDFYLGQLSYLHSGVFANTSNGFTFWDNVKDSDYKSDGTLKHVGHYNSHGTWVWDDDSDKNPGQLATIVAGNYYGYNFNHRSQLSVKKDLVPLSKSKALGVILHTDIAEYTYKHDKTQEREASVIIDDVHDTPQWKTPAEFVTKDGKARKDSVTVAYLVKAVQALQDQINDLKNENKKLKDQLS